MCRGVLRVCIVTLRRCSCVSSVLRECRQCSREAGASFLLCGRPAHGASASPDLFDLCVCAVCAVPSRSRVQDPHPTAPQCCRPSPVVAVRPTNEHAGSQRGTAPGSEEKD